MPIRFRCAYCNQLMGIARRKAGTVVRCPSCASQVTVPVPADEGEAKSATEPAPPIFERSDFDELFNPGGARSRQVASAPAFEHPAPFSAPAPVPAPPPPQNYLQQPAPPAPAPGRMDTGSQPVAPAAQIATGPGFWLDQKKFNLLLVAAIAALALAFVAGMYFGIHLQPKPKEESQGVVLEKSLLT